MSNKQIIAREIKTVIDEIIKLKLIIKNLNPSIISRSDKLGVLSFLNDRMSNMTKVSKRFKEPAAEVWENEGGS